MLVNHVLSSTLHSSIFEAILGYFVQYAPADAEVAVTVRPIASADLVHYHRPQLERKLRRPSLVTVHHDLEDANPAHDRQTFVQRYRQASHVVCLNQRQATLLRGLGIERLSVIPHGYNDDVLQLRAPATFASERVRLGFFSKRYRTRFKGEAYLQELAKRLSPAEFEFVLVGEGRSDTGQYLDNLGYRVRAYEYMPYAMFQQLYESIDYLLMCSNFEGGPASLPEALATGTPMLCTPVGFAPEMVEDGVNGLLLGRDIDVDAARIQTLTGTSELARRLRAGAHRRASEAATWQAIVARHFDLYQQVLARSVTRG